MKNDGIIILLFFLPKKIDPVNFASYHYYTHL